MTGALVWLLVLVSAPPTPFVLEVVREGATRVCPSEAVAARVVALLGRDPFGESGPRFEVTTRSKGTWSAEIRSLMPGRQVAVRRLKIPSPTCAALDETVALALALAIDPLSPLNSLAEPGASAATGGAGEPGDQAKVAATSARAPRRLSEPGERAARLQPVPQQPRNLLPAHTRSGWRMGIAAALGLAPSVAFGPHAAWLREGEHWGVALGGEAYFASSQARGVTTQVVVLAFEAEACWRWALDVCVDIEAGLFRADAERGATRPHTMAGLAFRKALGGGEARVGIGAPLWRQSLEVAGDEAWKTPAWIVTLSLGARSRDGSAGLAPKGR